MPELQTLNLTKKFGGLVAVNSVDFSLEPSELVCIIGPNGAGKSTLFNLVTGVLKPSGGKIFFQGADITGLRPSRVATRGISRKYQVPNIYEKLTVRENVRVPVQLAVLQKVGLFTKHSEEVERRVDHVLTQVHLDQRENELAANLSHGEKQWLDICIALANDPKLLLLDEPTTGMTAEESKTTGRLVRSINEHTSVALIEHDINVVREIASRVVVMHRGSVLANGSIKEIENNQAVIDIYLGKQ